MKCPHCRKDIRVALQNPARAGGGRRGAVSLKRPYRDNPGKRIGYTAKFGRKSAEFFSKSDAAAERYCNGLLAHKMGRKATSLQRNNKRESKK